jgi:hypothetical protein
MKICVGPGSTIGLSVVVSLAQAASYRHHSHEDHGTRSLLPKAQDRWAAGSSSRRLPLLLGRLATADSLGLTMRETCKVQSLTATLISQLRMHLVQRDRVRTAPSELPHPALQLTETIFICLGLQKEALVPHCRFHTLKGARDRMDSREHFHE